MGDDRPAAYRETIDGTEVSIYRASAAGMCVKALVASMQGRRPAPHQKASEILDLAASEGNLHEEVVVDKLKAEGYRIEDQQPEIMLQVIPRVYLRGHLDGLGYPPRARKQRVFEVKSMSDSVFAKWKKYPSAIEALLGGEFDRYAWQISVYMHATGLPAIYVAKNRSSGEVRIEEIASPPIEWSKIRRRIIEAEKWRKKDPELPDCDVDAGARFFCPFPYLHDDQVFGDEDDDTYQPMDSPTEMMLAGLCEHWEGLTKTIRAGDVATKERREVNERILSTMGEAKERVAGAYTVKRVDVSGRKALNPATLARLLNDAGFAVGLADLEAMVKDAEVAGAGYSYPKVERNS